MDFKISSEAQLIQAALNAQILSKNEMIENEFGSVKLITDYFVGLWNFLERPLVSQPGAVFFLALLASSKTIFM